MSSRRRYPPLPGCRQSTRTNQMLTSTGVAEFDTLFGEGVALGTVVCIGETLSGQIYSPYVHRYWAAEAIVHKHRVIHVCADGECNVLKTLPSKIDKPSPSSSSPSSSGHRPGDQMQIAWRYNQMKEVNSSIARTPCTSFDLATPMSSSTIDTADATTMHVDEGDATLDDLLDRLANVIDAYNMEKQGPKVVKNVLRIGIDCMGSAAWSCTPRAIVRFLAHLRWLLRPALAVCLITLPVDFFTPTLLSRMHANVDGALTMQVFGGTEEQSQEVYKGFHGRLHIVKLPRVNTLKVATPSSIDLVFKLKRSRFVVETFHLPPAFGDDSSSKKSGCGVDF